MRTTAQSPVFKARAIAGTHVVILAWDLEPGAANTAKLQGLLGFAIERSEIQNGTVVETYWMRSIKRFKDKDKGLPAGTPVSTAEHPVQSFQWGDYTARENHQYRYRIVPLYGKPKLIQADTASAVTIDVHTEPNMGTPAVASASGIRHDVFCNRGVIGSQAYARDMDNRAPDPSQPASEEMVWLSHGLFEGLMAFIGLAKDQHYGLRAAVYEFHYQPVVNAFAKAVEAGADVKIVYDAKNDIYKPMNEAAIQTAGLDALDAVKARTVSDGIRHNKFIVLLKDGNPIAVWTGSTNISDGGIFGHANIGHIVWDATVAQAYLKYWEHLFDNLTPTKLRPLNRAATPLPAGKPKPDSVTPVFSARDEENSVESLQWYADRMAEAKEIACITLAFNLDAVFEPFITADNDVLRYIVKDDDLGAGETVGHDRDVIFAAGAHFGDHDLENFLGERDNPLNKNNYIHTKFMLVDPLGTDPLVVSGSANFSRPSQSKNDENMLVIRGDTRAADIYFGEFMRIFDHHYARYVVHKLKAEGTGNPDAGYLKEKSEDWVPPHFDPKSYKSKRRRYFVGS